LPASSCFFNATGFSNGIQINSESSSPIGPPISEAEFEQMLLAKGIISEIPSGSIDHEEDFEPIEVTGQPLSETILEERR
jgi:hypothetical protein